MTVLGRVLVSRAAAVAYDRCESGEPYNTLIVTSVRMREVSRRAGSPHVVRNFHNTTPAPARRDTQQTVIRYGNRRLARGAPCRAPRTRGVWVHTRARVPSGALACAKHVD